jgi:phosphatidate cytidylyltransferase
MGKRTLWGAVYAGALIALFGFTILGPIALALFTLFLLKELATIQKMESRFPLLVLASILLSLGGFLGYGGPKEIVSSSILLSILLSFALLRAKQPALEIRRGLFAIAYIWVPLAFTIQHADDRPELILFIFVMIWSSDSMAYLFGRFFGKRPLAPTLSPKKTIEGMIGGVIGTIVIGLIANHYWGLMPVHIAASLALSVSITAPLGDLVASAVKREAGVKDSGVFLPGHGGALDRLDSFITAAPVALILYQYLS